MITFGTIWMDNGIKKARTTTFIENRVIKKYSVGKRTYKNIQIIKACFANKN